MATKSVEHATHKCNYIIMRCKIIKIIVQYQVILYLCNLIIYYNKNRSSRFNEQKCVGAIDEMFFLFIISLTITKYGHFFFFFFDNAKLQRNSRILYNFYKCIRTTLLISDCQWIVCIYVIFSFALIESGTELLSFIAYTR
jgi:hypothetical protein